MRIVPSPPALFGLRPHTPAFLALAGCLWLFVPAPAPAQDTVASADGSKQAVIQDFNERIAKYMELRRKIQGGSPPATAPPEKLLVYRDQLRDRIVAARSSTGQGDIFSPRTAEYFKRQLAAMLNGPHGGQIRASLKRAEPVHGIPVSVNGRYPPNVPLESTPPSLLLSLPLLPKELEYRVVNRDLVLRDKDANLIVDFIPDALPEAQAPSH
ncbi:MAG: hypothetical protein JO041_10655 [Acidobacteria bacterium]|nr:hypothetical protein [Acidobacteriota bacterium]